MCAYKLQPLWSIYAWYTLYDFSHYNALRPDHLSDILLGKVRDVIAEGNVGDWSRF